MSAEGGPVLRLVKGNPTPEELAAVVTVLSASSGAVAADVPAAPSLWAAPQLRAPLTPGPGAWRASALPR